MSSNESLKGAHLHPVAISLLRKSVSKECNELSSNIIRAKHSAFYSINQMFSYVRGNFM